MPLPLAVSVIVLAAPVPVMLLFTAMPALLASVETEIVVPERVPPKFTGLKAVIVKLPLRAAVPACAVIELPAFRVIDDKLFIVRLPLLV